MRPPDITHGLALTNAIVAQPSPDPKEVQQLLRTSQTRQRGLIADFLLAIGCIQ
jgi:hypothetical protein